MQGKTVNLLFLGLLIAGIGSLGMMTPDTALSAELKLDDGKLNDTDQAVRAQLGRRLAEIKADPEAYKDALYWGELRATLCKVCHGADGNSVREGVPNLAGQAPVYIVDQFNRYADGRRIDYWMGGLSAHFTDDDKIKLAIYFSVQKTKPGRGGKGHLMDRGRQIYKAHCEECHGADGRSDEGYARLAGQRYEYIVKMLKEFKTATGRRFSPFMFPRANMLKKEEDIEAVATYLSHLE